MLRLFLFFAVSLFVIKVNCQTKQIFLQKITRQDSINLKNNSCWIDISFGPSLTIAPRPDYFDLLVFGPTLDFTFINKNYSLGKIKASLHHGINIFENIAQKSIELNYMTGKIVVFKHSTQEYYWGIGVIAGQKQGKLIYDSFGSGCNGFVCLPNRRYEEIDFIFLSIPLEYKFVFSVLGLGFDANLNPYLPYIGAKWSLKIGSKYKLE